MSGYGASALSNTRAKAWNDSQANKDVRKIGDKYATFRTFAVEGIAPLICPNHLQASPGIHCRGFGARSNSSLRQRQLLNTRNSCQV